VDLGRGPGRGVRPHRPRRQRRLLVDDALLRLLEALRVALETAEEIIAKGQTPSRDTFLAAAKSQTAFDVEGRFGPPLNYSKPSTVLGGAAPRPFSVNIWLGKYDKGNVTPVSDKPFSPSSAR
jgi:hypothetical protein